MEDSNNSNRKNIVIHHSLQKYKHKIFQGCGINQIISYVKILFLSKSFLLFLVVGFVATCFLPAAAAAALFVIL